MADTTTTAAVPATATTAAGGEGAGAASATTAVGEPKAAETALGTQTKGTSGEAGAGEPKKPVPLEITLPKGVTLDDEAMAAYKELAVEFGFDSQKASKNLEFAVALRNQAAVGLQKQISDAVQAQRAEWLSKAQADKEIGGQAWDNTLLLAKSAVERLGGNALREVLNQSGLGNHPEIIRAFSRAGKAISEDSIAGRAGANNVPPAKTEQDAQKKMYPTMFPPKE